jgi:hypothetical protein
MSNLDLARTPTDQLGASINAVIHKNVSLYVGQILIGLFCSVLGGYVAAWLAKHDELLNGSLSSLLCVALGIYTIAMGRDPNALCAQMLLLVANPAMALVGGDPMRRQRRGRLQPV